MTNKKIITEQPRDAYGFPLPTQTADQGLYSPGHDREARQNALSHLTSAYADESPDNEAKWNASKARTWRYDAELENLDRLRKSDPAAFTKMPANLKLMLGHYADGRDAATAAGIDTKTDPKKGA